MISFSVYIQYIYFLGSWWKISTSQHSEGDGCSELTGGYVLYSTIYIFTTTTTSNIYELIYSLKVVPGNPEQDPLHKNIWERSLG